VATNLLESMVVNRQQTVAEADDIVNTLLDGVHGLVLAAETAVGIDPSARSTWCCGSSPRSSVGA
jgi:pyruvate kinase